MNLYTLEDMQGPNVYEQQVRQGWCLGSRVAVTLAAGALSCISRSGVWSLLMVRSMRRVFRKARCISLRRGDLRAVEAGLMSSATFWAEENMLQRNRALKSVVNRSVTIADSCHI